MDEADQEKERKSRLEERAKERQHRFEERAKLEQKAKGSPKISRGRHASKSPRRSRKARSSRSPGPDIHKPRSSRSPSRRQPSSGASMSRHRSRSPNSKGDHGSSSVVQHDSDALGSPQLSSTGRKGRLKTRSEDEQAIKAAARRDNLSHEQAIKAAVRRDHHHLSDTDADLRKKKLLAARARSRSPEPIGSLNKHYRRHPRDEKAGEKAALSRSRHRDEIKPGVEQVRNHRHKSSKDDDKLSKSYHSANVRQLASEQNENEEEVQLQAISVEDNQDAGRVQIVEQRNHDWDQRLNEVVQQNKRGNGGTREETSVKAGVSRLIAFLLFLFGVGVGVAIGFFLRGGCEPCKPCDTDAPTFSPTPQITVAPTTAGPTINFVYDPPSDEDCLRIRQSLPVNGQSEMAVTKIFDILVDTTLTDESLEPSNWPEVVAEATAAYLIPDLVGCPGSDESAVKTAASNGSSGRRNLRNIRYVIANAIATGERRSYYSCEDGAPAPCYKAAVTLTLLLKGDEANVGLFTLISDVILTFQRGAPLVDKIGLSRNTYASVKIVGMEEVPYEAPSEAACDAIANRLAVPGQESMINKTFEVSFDVTLTSSGVTNLLPELTTGIEEYLIPELAGCESNGVVDGNSRRLTGLGNGKNLRFAVGNAIATATEVPEVPCQPGRGAQCVHVVVILEVSLKGDEQDLDVENLITNVINGNTGASIVNRYGLSTSTFVEINLVYVESKNPPSEPPALLLTPSPSIAMMVETPSPTDSPSRHPTVNPAVDPATEDPIRAPTQSPTKAPTTPATPPPTVAPQPGLTPPPTPPPTGRPTIAPSMSPSETPSTNPSLAPSGAPSTNPSLVPSGTPSIQPSVAPSPAPTSGPTFTPTTPAPTSAYLGCYKDTSSRDLRIQGSHTISIADCKNLCKDIGFAYAAVQLRKECYCDDSYGSYGEASNCDSDCLVDPNESGCGGGYANSVYLSGAPNTGVSDLEQGLYCGCTADVPSQRDLEHVAPYEYFGQKACILYCRAKGYAFAGLQNGSRCYCGNNPGTHALSENCNMACAYQEPASCYFGWYTCFCGGVDANNLFRTSTSVSCPSVTIPAGYLGCFQDSSSRDLRIHGSHRISIADCKNLCKDIGFAYAAVQLRKECFCDDSYGSYGISSNCISECVVDPNEAGCGGGFANSVYSSGAQSTGVSDLEANLYCGCTADAPDQRDLEHVAPYEYFGQKACVLYCRSKGYDFAGLQNGSLCYCGNNPGTHGLSENCTVGCEWEASVTCYDGSTSCTCGGVDANDLFRTSTSSASCPS